MNEELQIGQRVAVLVKETTSTWLVDAGDQWFYCGKTDDYDSLTGGCVGKLAPLDGELVILELVSRKIPYSSVYAKDERDQPGVWGIISDE